MSPFDSPLENWLMSNALLFIFKSLKSKFSLKFHQMDIWFEFLNVHMNGKKNLVMIDMDLNGKT
jgi:hypothetical protein